MSHFPKHLKEEEQNLEGWLSLSHNKIDLTEFPYREWLKHQQVVFKENMDDLQSIPHLQGPLKVRKTIARMLLFNRGVKCEPEQIIIGAGTQVLLKQLLELFQKEDVIGLDASDAIEISAKSGLGIADVLEASYKALVDSIEYFLLKQEETAKPAMA